MSPNESQLDRGIRGVVAVLAFIGAVFFGLASVPGAILALVGLVLAVTAAVGFCPLYRVLGISTCKVDKG